MDLLGAGEVSPLQVSPEGREVDTIAKEEREDILSEVRDKLFVVAIVLSCSLHSLVSLRSTSLNFTKPHAKIS